MHSTAFRRNMALRISSFEETEGSMIIWAVKISRQFPCHGLYVVHELRIKNVPVWSRHQVIIHLLLEKPWDRYYESLMSEDCSSDGGHQNCRTVTIAQLRLLTGLWLSNLSHSRHWYVNRTIQRHQPFISRSVSPQIYGIQKCLPRSHRVVCIIDRLSPHFGANDVWDVRKNDAHHETRPGRLFVDQEVGGNSLRSRSLKRRLQTVSSTNHFYSRHTCCLRWKRDITTEKAFGFLGLSGDIRRIQVSKVFLLET